MKLRSKTVVPYKGEVVDLCVENSHTYNVEGIAVHNSGGGSLVAYVLYITDLDPLFWDLPFARFLSVHRCLSPDTKVLMSDGSSSALRDVKVGDSVVSQDGSHRKVTFTMTTKHEKTYRVKVNGTTFTCSENHVWLTVGPDGQPVKKYTSELSTSDELYTYHYEHH
jgi:intein/homing endonuclease